jgi:hypothetical protein
MTKQLKGRILAEEEELLSVLSELMSEIPPNMILVVLAAAPDNEMLSRAMCMEMKIIEYFA